MKAPDLPVTFCRHDLLYADPDHALPQSPESAPILDWMSNNRPVVVRRPGVLFNGEGVHCGIPSLPHEGKRRISFVMPRQAIRRSAGLPSLKECIHLLQPDRQARLTDFLEACCANHLFPEVFGSLAWQHLTGLPYLHGQSDIDLRFRIADGPRLRRLGLMLRGFSELCLTLCDVEIELWNGYAFSWREYQNASPRLLVKTTHQVFLQKKALLPFDDNLDVSLVPEMVAAEICSALTEELDTYPKPGLVSRHDSGSHRDMNASHFSSSIVCLEPWFTAIAASGLRGTSMPELRSLGISAEEAMCRATQGVNTHRGALFTLGLLAAAMGHKIRSGSRETLGALVKELWGPLIQAGWEAQPSHGQEAARRYGAGGVRSEAALGFQSIYQYGLPAFKAALQTQNRSAARIHCFFSLLEKVEDTTLLHRGGREGLSFAREVARDFNRHGGVLAPDWKSRALEAHQEFIKRNLSCGGVADLLAATIFIQRMEDRCPD